jgi:hypothetical protein
VTTNYVDTFIRVAEDCPVESAEVPARAGTVAALEYGLVSARPYALTSDDLLFEVYAIRNAVPDAERAAERDRFSARSRACLRASPLAKRHGWGVHHDAEGRVALVAVESERYRELAADPALKQLRAMRSRRAARG